MNFLVMRYRFHKKFYEINNNIMSKEITKRETDYSQWYNDIILKAGWQITVQ